MKTPDGEPLIVLITHESSQEAEELAKVLVHEKLAACANVLPGAVSIYRWQGAVQRDSEALIVVKTRRPLLERLTTRVKALHSYDEPEVIALPIVGGSESYLNWLTEVTPNE